MRRIMILCGTIIFLAIAGTSAVEQILLIQSRDDYLSMVTNKLENELSGSFNVNRLKRIRDTNEIAEVWNNLNPKVIIVLEKHAKSSSLYWFREYLQSHSSKFSNTAFIFVKDYFIDQSEVFMDNATGISFLPPIILGVEKLQEEFHIDVRSIGIIHSRSIRKTLIDNSASCILKGISLTMKPIPDRNDPSFSKTLTDALNNLKKQKVDAFWIVEDENLLQLQLVREILGPFLKKNGIPTIVNNEALLAAPWEIGTVCIVPDPMYLSNQIADKIHELKRNDWIVSSPSIDPLDIYSKQLHKIPLSRSPKVSVSSDRQIETPPPVSPSTVTPDSSDQQTKSPAPISQLTIPPVSPDIQIVKPIVSDTARGPIMSNIPIETPDMQKIAPVVQTTPVTVVVSNLKTAPAPNKRDFPSNKTNKIKMTNFPQKRNEIRVEPELFTVTDERVQSSPDENILKYILITSNHAAVRQSSDTVSLVIGWALKGQQYPVFEEKGGNLRISFFNVPGWITAKDIMSEETSPSAFKKLLLEAQKHLVVLMVVTALFAAVLIILLVVKKMASRSANDNSNEI